MREGQRDELSTLLARADALMEMRRDGEALIVLEQTLGLYPNHARAQCRRALVLLRLNRIQECRKAAEQACVADPEEEWAHRIRCLALLRLGSRGAAEAAAREAVRLKPEGAEGCFLLAKTALARGNHAEARKHADRLCVLAPNWSVTHAMLGDIAAKKRDWAGGEQHYREALSHEPTDGLVMNALGRMLQQQGRHDEALECFQEATRLAPANEQVQGSIQHSLNRYIGNFGYTLACLLLLRLLVIVSPALGIAVLIASVAFLVYRRRSRLAELKDRAPILYTLYTYRRRRAWSRRSKWLALWVGIFVLWLSLTLFFALR